MKQTNPKDALGTKKVPLSGMPAPVLLEAGLVKLHGDLKYGPYNWREAGVRGSVYYDAAMRHLMAWWEGEDLDPDSGIHHLAHAITGLAVLRDSQIQNNWSDDRPSPTKAGWVGEFNVKAAQLIEKHGGDGKSTTGKDWASPGRQQHGGSTPPSSTIDSLQGVSPDPHTDAWVEAWNVLGENPDFVEFLQEQNCLDEWVSNFKPLCSVSHAKAFVCPRHLTLWAFEWESTSEGLEFWRKIHSLWSAQCK